MRPVAVICTIAAISGCAQEDTIQDHTPSLLVPDPVAVDVIVLDSAMPTYSWLDEYEVVNTLVNRVHEPVGYSRIEVDSGSYADWLRHMPLKEGTPEVLLYDGTLKWNQSAQHVVIDMDVDPVDLQQCADAIMRLRAEYLYQAKDYDKIHFNYASGDEVAFSKYLRGFKPVVSGSDVSWRSCSSCDLSYDSFRDYLTQIFMYAGTLSMSKELDDVDLYDMQIGDMFVYGGSPGHMMLVMDMAVNERGDQVFLLGQSFMPAQEMHVVVNPLNEELTPWYSIDQIDDRLRTPEWSFAPSALMRFPED